MLPPHSNHLTQSQDFSIFGSFKKMYSQECKKYMNLIPGINIAKYNAAELADEVRKKAKISNRYNQAPHLTQDSKGKVATS